MSKIIRPAIVVSVILILGLNSGCRLASNLQSSKCVDADKSSKIALDLALADCNRAIGIDPSNSSPYVWRGVIKEKMNDRESAQEDFHKAYVLGPNDWVANLYFCNEYLDSKYYDDAIRACDNVIRLKPDLAQRKYETRNNLIEKKRVAEKLPHAKAESISTALDKIEATAGSMSQETAATASSQLPQLLAATPSPQRWSSQNNSTSVERRLSLVVGNSKYLAGPLPNPVVDANRVASSLQAVGFEVKKALDVDQNAMRAAIRDFGARLEAAGPDAVALFYFSGHGVQFQGDNYLVPVGAKLDREADVPLEAIMADEILRQMEYGKSRVKIMILDACRNNLFARSFRSTDRGLARMDGPRGTLIAYATAPGHVAADGEPGAGSPYSTALAREIREPGMAAEEVFRAVRQEVLRETDNEQVTWESSSLTEAFYFAQGS